MNENTLKIAPTTPLFAPLFVGILSQKISNPLPFKVFQFNENPKWKGLQNLYPRFKSGCRLHLKALKNQGFLLV